MTIEELTGRLIAKKGNLETDLQHRRQAIVLMEADLKKARGEADVISGALQQVGLVLDDLEGARK